jgi:hypothetical protein
MIVKIIVLISQPVRMELILRKRIATTIGKTEGWWSGKAMKYLLGYVGFLAYWSRSVSSEWTRLETL